MDLEFERAWAQWDEAIEFGQETGNCGNCGKNLDATEQESGLCHDCQIEYDELFGD